MTLDNGSVQHITELVEKRRERISKWNALRLRRGEEYWAYKVTDSTYPVRLSPEQHKKLKRELKGVLDRRAWKDKYPYKARAVENYQHWGPVYNTALSVLISGVK